MATGVETREAVKRAVIEAASRTAASRPSTAAAAAATDASESMALDGGGGAEPPRATPAPPPNGSKLPSPPVTLPARLHGLWLRRGDAVFEGGNAVLAAKEAGGGLDTVGAMPSISRCCCCCCWSSS